MGISEVTLTDRLERERNVWLCTLRVDGSPHGHPGLVRLPRRYLSIGSGERNLKVRDPRVSLALEHGDAPCVAEGRARVHRGTLREDVLGAISTKYGGWDVGAEIEPFGPRVLLEVRC
jgi:hypothetical protein